MYNNIFTDYKAAVSKSADDQEKETMEDLSERKLTKKEIARAAAKGSASAKPKDQVSVKKAPWDEDNTNDVEDDGEGLDKVQPKAVKKKFKDRKDKDIDNDGDVDGSDEYLHKRRKAISKDIEKDIEDEGEDDEKAKKEFLKKDKKEGVKESIRDKLLSVLENKQTAGATKAEDPDEKDKNNKGAMDMKKTAKDAKVDDTVEKAPDDAKKAGAAGPQAKARNGGDNTAMGDKTIINKVKEAYESMYAKKED
jgi:hypothetical protein